MRATCELDDKAGWQHVKIRRRRSSLTGPTSGGASSGGRRDCAWTCRSCRVASRRNRSIARLRAVVTIQAPGLGGQPESGHLSTAMRERLLNRILGDVDVAEGADQRGDRTARLLAERSGDFGGHSDGSS